MFLLTVEIWGADGNHKLWYMLGLQPQRQEGVAERSLLWPMTACESVRGAL